MIEVATTTKVEVGRRHHAAAAAGIAGFSFLVIRSVAGRSIQVSLVLLVAAGFAGLLVHATRDVCLARPMFVLAIGICAFAAARLVPGLRLASHATLGALALNTVAAVAEEAVFRRALYAWLAPIGAPLAIGVTAVAFALVHVPAYGWRVIGVDLGAGVLFGWQRWASGRWEIPAATHVIANLLAVA